MVVNRGRRNRARRLCAPLSLVAVGLLLASCGSADKFARKVDPKYGVPSSPRVVADGQRIPKGGGAYRVGKPYVVAGRNYVPEDNPDYTAEGMASWYGDDFHGRLTANGEVFDKEAVTAAHPTLPMPSYVRVTNVRNRKSLIVRVNDRGPFHSDRVIDLSHKAADLLGFRQNGVARVKVEYVGRASLEGSDDRKLIATLRQGEPAPAPIQVASARPGLPAMETARASRGPVPVPGQRPYSLGEPAPAQATEMEMTSSRVRQPAIEAQALPPTAFAPVRQNAPAAGFMSGRGLY
jgi:rare lipoprotein A